MQPIEPSQEDCCNSGCNPCVFDVYAKKLALYDKLKVGSDILEIASKNAISDLKYTEFTVIKNISLTPEHHLLVFMLSSVETLNESVNWKPGDHFLVKFIKTDLKCTRAYTPLKQYVKSESEFSIIVKRYTHGVVSNYLCDLTVGQQTLWRGPYGSFKVELNMYKRMVMICQGTGIAPFIAIIETILKNEDDETQIVLYYCCQNVDSILIRDKIYLWNAYWNFKYTIYVAIKGQNAELKYREPIIYQKMSLDDVKKLKPFSAKDMFLLCGSMKFMLCYRNLLEIEGAQNIKQF